MKSEPITRDSFVKYLCALLNISGAFYSRHFPGVALQVIMVRHHAFSGTRDAFFSSYGDFNKLWLRVPGGLHSPSGIGHGPGCIGFFVEEAFIMLEYHKNRKDIQDSICLDGYEVVSARDLVQGKIS